MVPFWYVRSENEGGGPRYARRPGIIQIVIIVSEQRVEYINTSHRQEHTYPLTWTSTSHNAVSIDEGLAG